MNAEELARRARQAHEGPPWDDLREQRVLARVLAERKGTGRRRGRAIALSAATVVVAAAAAFLVVRARGPREAAPIATAPSEATAAGEQTMALADGSRAVLLAGAGLSVDEQTPSRVRIAQQRGVVRYEVKPDPAREFTVHAGGSVVRVRGTVFVVDVSSDAVEVRVERGHVEVDDGARTRDLTAGETLRVPARVDPAPSGPAAPIDAPPRSSGGPSVAPSSPSELLARADAARVAGRLDEAASALETLLARYPRDDRAQAALFSLGRVERARGHHQAAARDFERCARRGGALARDAWAEAAASWTTVGRRDAARAAANEYLARFPDGPEAPQMRTIAAP